jgi:glycine oxidase
VNVIVVGGGVIGLAVARELASRGARVRIIEQRAPGGGATRASAGMLAPLIEGHSPEMLELGCRSFAEWDGFVGRLRTDAGMEVEYRRSGTLQVARSAAGAASLSALAGDLAARNVAHTLLDGAAARAMEPALSPGIRAGLLIPEHGYVRVAELIAALQAAAARDGVEVIHGHAHQIEQPDGPVLVAVDDRSLAADALVIAAGSWSSPLMSPAIPVRPIRGQLVHLRFASPPVSRVVWGEGCYLVPWNDGSLLVGATSEDVGFDESSTAAGVDGLLAAAAGDVPVSAGATVQEIRVGLRPATPDALPLIGRSSTMRGVFYATGHFRNGVLLAPLTARLLGELIVDGREGPLLALVAPERMGL